MRHAHALTMQRLESDSALYSVEGVSSYRPHPVSRESSLSHTRAYRVAVPSQRYPTHTPTLAILPLDPWIATLGSGCLNNYSFLGSVRYFAQCSSCLRLRLWVSKLRVPVG